MFNSSPQQQKAEIAVKKYLDSLDAPVKCEIVKFSNFHPFYFTYEDDPLYEKYKSIPLKVDSIKRNFKPSVRGWAIYVTYKGKDLFGDIGRHAGLCGLNKDLTKCVTMVPSPEF